MWIRNRLKFRTQNKNLKADERLNLSKSEIRLAKHPFISPIPSFLIFQLVSFALPAAKQPNQKLHGLLTKNEY